MTFRVGQKVVCVNIGPSRYVSDEGAPPYEMGAIYTITGFRELQYAIGVFVAELPDEGPNWLGHDIRRFRPIVERKTDISIFTKMLTPQGVEA